MGCRLTSGREFAPPSKSTSARNGIVNAQPAPFILKIVVPQLCLYASRIAFDVSLFDSGSPGTVSDRFWPSFLLLVRRDASFSYKINLDPSRRACRLATNGD